MLAYISEINDDVKKTYLSVTFELKKHFKRKRILIALGLALFISLIFSFLPLLLKSDFPETGLAFANNNLNFVNMLIVISAAIFAGDAISGEFEKKTGLLLFPTPQRRSTIFLGKYIAAIIPVFLSVAVYYGATITSIIVIYGTGGLAIELLSSFMLALLYSTAIVSLIYFFSSIMKRSIASSLVGFFLVMMILPIISTIFNAAGIEPWFIVTYSSDLITTVLGVTTEGFGPGGEFGGSSEPDTFVGIIVMVWYAVVGFIGGLTMALRRRME